MIPKINPSCEMSFLTGLKNLFFHPSEFFGCMVEESVKPAFFSYLIFVIITILVEVLLAFFLKGPYQNSFFFSILFKESSIQIILLSILAKFLLLILVLFVFSIILHGLVKLFKGQGLFTDTFKTYAYSLIPYSVIALIPLVGLIGLIYIFVLMIFGLSLYHNFSKFRAGLVIFLTWIILYGVSFVVGGFLINVLDMSSLPFFVAFTPLF